MFALIKGKVEHRDQETLIVDVNGVGYEITVAASIEAAVGDIVRLVVFTDVKENSISLYGFRSFEEREVFLLLRKVKGIGSRLALNVLSGVGAEPLLLAIGRGDVDSLKRVPGIGKKTAERVIVELREQVGELVPSGDQALTAQISRSNVAPEPVEDAVLALEKLGFVGDRARKAVQAALASAGSSSPNASELVRLSLAHL